MNGSQDNPINPAANPAEQQAPAAEPQNPPVNPAPPVMAQPAAGRFFQMSPAVAHDPRAKSPALACFLSLMPGLGQVYTGYYVRGFTYIIVIAGIITILASGDADNLAPFLGLFMAFFWMHNVIDAGRRAAFYNQTLSGGDVDAFPPEMKLPGVGGSIFAGVGLIVVGIIALSYTKYDMSLAWVEDWWPVAPILIGVYLVGLAVRDRMKEDA
jgi:hypothetical protein